VIAARGTGRSQFRYVYSRQTATRTVSLTTLDLAMSTRIVRIAFVLSIFVTGSAVASESDARQGRAEIALSNAALQMRYLASAVSGQAFYGPDILTFGSADSLTDLSARVEVNVAAGAPVSGSTV
jgi:hypothetical protein